MIQLLLLIFCSLTCCAAVAPESREKWDLKLRIHQEVGEALFTPLNLFMLKETFFPRVEGVSPPLSVAVHYNINTSNTLSDANEESENLSFSFLWSQIPLQRIRGDCLTFRLLNSYSQPHSLPVDIVPHVELDLNLKNLPNETTGTLLHEELYGITTMVTQE